MRIARQKVAGLAAAGLLVALAAPQAYAATTTGSMSVSLSVPKACTLTVSQNVDFGTQTPTGSTTLDAGVTGGTTNGQLSVNCRKQNTSVNVALSSASTVSSSGGNMTTTTSSVAYSLYLPKSTTWSSADLNVCDYTAPTAWPSTGLEFTNWASTGAKSIAVCAKTTIDQNTEAGEYSDTVNVTVTY